MVKKKLFAFAFCIAAASLGTVNVPAALAIDPTLPVTPIPIDLIKLPTSLFGNPKGFLRWETTVPNMFLVYPAIGPDRTLYVSASVKYGGESQLFAYNTDGSVKWKVDTGPGNVKSAPAFGADGTIYAGSDKNFYAIRPDGTEKWKIPTPVTETPAVGADGTIYAVSSQTLYALQADGTKKWEFTPVANHLTSPVIGADGTVYVGTDWKALIAVKPNGVKKWEFPAAEAITAAPAIGADGVLYFGAKNGTFYAVSPEGGKKWTFSAADVITSSPVIGADGTVYFGSADKKLYALDANGAAKWSYDGKKGNYYTPAIGADGMIYAMTGDMLYALKTDGKVKWEYGTDAMAAPVIGTDGTVYAGKMGGKLIALGTVPASSITLNRDTLALKAGESDLLAATVVPDNASNKSVTWSSSDERIAVVDGTGKVTGVAAGTARIVAKADDGGFTSACEVIVTGASHPPAPAITFSDIAGHWAEGTIKRAVELGVVSGYSDGTFKPNGSVTRAEFAVMLINALHPEGEGAELAFTDLDAIGSWAVQAVSQAVKLGIINGYPDGTYRPGANISHSEMVIMVVRAAKLPTDAQAKTPFADDGDIPGWAKDAAAAAARYGVTDYIVNNRFAPDALSSRAESAASIVNMLKANK